MTDHTEGALTFSESEYEPNRFTIYANGKWLLCIQHNGEQTMPQERENMRRMAACWNACEGSSTEWLEFQCNPDAVEQFGAREPFETRYTNELRAAVKIKEQRDELLASLKELLPMWQSGIDEPWIRRAKAAIANNATGEPI